MSDFTFNGISASSLGLRVSGKNPFNSPQKIYDKYTVPGRSGDIYIPTGAYSNVPVTYEVYIKRTSSMNLVSKALRNWLLLPDGYCTITDTYNPNEVRLGKFDGNLDIVLGVLFRTGTAMLTFDCKPQRYSSVGYNTWFNVPNDENDAYPLLNASKITALPLFKVVFGGTQSTVITLQKLSIESTVYGTLSFDEEAASEEGQSTVYYDAELGMAYYGDGSAAVGVVTVTGDITIPAETTRHIWHNSQNAVTVQRREWYL